MWGACKKILERPGYALLIIPLLFLILRAAYIPVVWPTKPPSQCLSEPFDGCGFIFDEAHYIPFVRRMMRGEVVNLEHPPLSKYLIILGITLLGDNPWGWRLPMVVCSAITVYLVGLIAYRLAKSIKLAMIGQLLISADVTFFNIGGLAMLDAPALMFMMLAFYLYVVKRELLMGVALGLALLAKSSMFIAILIAFPLMAVAYPLVNHGRIDLAIEALKRQIKRVILPALLLFLIGLGVWNSAIQAFPTPLHLMGFMLEYHTSLPYHDPARVELPLSWIIPPITRPPSPYHVTAADSIRITEFWGVSSPLWWSIWLLIPIAYLYVRDNRPVKRPCPELDLLSWFAATFGAFLVIAHAFMRWVYLFYFLQISTVMAALIPAIFSRNGHELTLKTLLAAQLLWMLIFLPSKPIWLAEALKSVGLGYAPWQ